MIITKTPLRMSFFGRGTDLPVYYALCLMLEEEFV